MDSPACRVCGRRPAINVNLRRHVGMLILQRFIKFEGPLCKEHGSRWRRAS